MACAGRTGRRGTRLTNNIATFDPAAYDTTNQAVVSPSTGRIVSGPRYNGIVLPGDGFEGDGNDLAVASDPAVLALFVDAPRGFADTHANVFEPRIGAAYSINDKTIVKLSSGVFHNRVTVSDSMFLGGNPPFQPQVGVATGLSTIPAASAAAGSLPFGMTAMIACSSTRPRTCGRLVCSGRFRTTSSST